MARMDFEGIADIATLNGGMLDIMFRDAMKTIREDLVDRPALNKPRKIALEVSLIPTADDKGTLDTVKTDFAVKITSPVAKTPTITMGLDDEGHLFAQEFSRKDPRQQDLPLEKGDKKS